MLTKALKLTPLVTRDYSDEAEAKLNIRVFNVDKIQIFKTGDQYKLDTEIGNIELEEGDEILLENHLFKVSYSYLNPGSDSHPWQNSPIANEIFMQDDLEHEDLKEHPLSFLFEPDKFKG
ncbi:MAG TPA: hypothetical protein VD770_05090 [Coxiellaceae bacterium]|nr:hypothetical protein [Coxiellaceae bacterium]